MTFDTSGQYTKTIYTYFSILLVFLVVAYDYIAVLHSQYMSWLLLVLVFLSLLMWEEHPGIVLLLLILFLQSVKYMRSGDTEK